MVLEVQDIENLFEEFFREQANSKQTISYNANVGFPTWLQIEMDGVKSWINIPALAR